MADFKAVGALRIEENTSLWIYDVDGDLTTYEVPLTAGLWYILGDDSANDLLYHLETRIAANVASLVDGGGLSMVRFDLSSSGIVSHYTNDLDCEIQWTAASGTNEATDVQSWLRLEGYGSSSYAAPGLPGAGVASRVASYSFYPSYYLQVDLRPYETRARQFVPDNGNAQTIKIAQVDKYRLRFMTYGAPRTAGFTEYHMLEDFYEHAMSGRPFRLYADATKTAAYSTSDRYGYQTMTMVPKDFDAAPLQANWYKNFTFDCDAYGYTE